MNPQKTAEGKAIEATPKIASQGIHPRLKAAREMLKLSQRAMAERLGIGLRTWQKYECGETPPGAKVLEALQREGFSAGWVLTGQEPIRRARDALEVARDWVKDNLLDDAVWVLIGGEPVRLPRRTAEALRDQTKADLLGDAEAAHRPKIRTEVSVARLRAAHEGLEAAQNTVGYQLPVLLQEAIRVLMYSHGLDREGAVILVDFMKRQAELDKG